MKNNFLNGNERISEKIRAFRTEPTAETYGAVLDQIRDRMMADGHFLIPVWTPEEEKDSENPSFNMHQLQIVRPAQEKFSTSADGREFFRLAKHCFANLILRIGFIKLADVFRLPTEKPFPSQPRKDI